MGSNPPSTCLCKPQAWGSSCVHCVSSWTSAHLGCPCAVLHPRAAAQVHVTPHLGCNETAPSPLSVPPSASQGNLSKVPMWSWHTLHTSLCFHSNSLWIKKKKKKERKRRARSWILPTRCSFHSLTLLFSGLLRPHRPLLLAPRALSLALSHARVASLCTHLKGNVPPKPELPVLAHLRTCQSWAPRRPSQPGFGPCRCVTSHISPGHVDQPVWVIPVVIPGTNNTLAAALLTELHRIWIICHQLHFLHKSNYF